MRIATTPEKLPGELEKLDRKLRQALLRGAENAARRGVKIMRQRTPVDTGQLKMAWKVVKHRASSMEPAVLVNDAPHAGIVELGARPHKVSMAGVEAIWRWVWRHRVGMGFATASGRAMTGDRVARETLRIAWAIAKKIEQVGQRPTYFVKGALPELRRALQEEIDLALSRLREGGR